MDRDIERSFIRAFFPKARQERILYELNNSKKRSRCIFELQHRLDASYMQRWSYPVFDPATYYMLEKLGAPEKCYIMCHALEYDGTFADLKDIYDHNSDKWQYASCVICIPDKLAVVSSEETGYLLLERGIINVNDI